MIFLILVLFQFQSGQMTIATFTQSLLLSSSYSSSSSSSNNNNYYYDFFWEKDITTSSENRNNRNVDVVLVETSKNEVDVVDDKDIDTTISRETIVDTATKEESMISSGDPIDVEEDEDDDTDDNADDENDTTTSSTMSETTLTYNQNLASSDQASVTLEQGTATTASTTTVPVYKRPSEWKLFPRWNTTTGIPIQPLIEFIFGVAYDNATTIETKTIRTMFPETLYVFDVTGVYTSYNIRQRTHKTFIHDRVKPTEMIMKLAHEILIQHVKELQTLQLPFNSNQNGLASSLLGLGGTSKNNATTNTEAAVKSYKLQRHKVRKMEQKWKHLQQLIHDKGSFPFLAWYGDFTSCNRHNWKRHHRTDTDTESTATTMTRRLASSATWKTTQRALLERDDENDEEGHSFISYESIPLFTTCAQIGCQYAFPLPTYKTIQGSLASTFQWKKRMQEYHDEYPVPLEEKMPKLVWRGSLTGDIQNYTNIRWLLCKYVTEASDDEKQYYDIGLTKIPPRHDKVSLNLTIVGDLIPGIFPMAAFQNYRAILDIDGNSWSSRFGSLLCYHSVILKVEPMYVDYFHYSTLIPNVHYVPVHYNLSNLYSQTLYVMDPNNQNDIQRIIRNANMWCQHNMVYSKIANDYLTIFDQYLEYLDIASSTTATPTTTTPTVTDVTTASNWKTIWNQYKEHEIFSNKELFNMVPLK